MSSRKVGDPAEGHLDNRRQFQGAFNEFDEEVGWNDFALRSYDPQIGRWLQQDPFQEYSSPYVGMGNDPINLIDPNGGETLPFLSLKLLSSASGSAVSVASAAANVVGLGSKAFAIASATMTVLNFVNAACTKINTDITTSGVGNLSLTKSWKGNSRANESHHRSEGGGWKDLYKKDLIVRYTQEHGGLSPTENDLGDYFENLWFLLTVKEDPDGAAEHNLRKNHDVWDDAEDRNTVPDFTSDAGYYKGVWPFNRLIPVREGSAFELKQSKKRGIYLSSNNRQIKGHIDNLAARFAVQILDGFQPTLTLVTTADVQWSPSTSSYAFRKSIWYMHRIVKYRIKSNGDWEFTTSSIAKQIFGN